MLVKSVSQCTEMVLFDKLPEHLLSYKALYQAMSKYYELNIPFDRLVYMHVLVKALTAFRLDVQNQQFFLPPKLNLPFSIKLKAIC